MKKSEKRLRPATIVIAGSARLTEKTSINRGFVSVSIELELDPVDWKIVDVCCPLTPFLGQKILLSALLGYEFKEGLGNAVKELRKRFFSVNRNAVIEALNEAHSCYDRLMEK